MEAGILIDLRGEARQYLPDVADLPHLYPAARETWLGRMRNEYASADVFEALSAQLARAGALGRHVEECAAMAAEERLHGALCGAVVEATGGSATVAIPARSPFPLHTDVAPMEAVLRNVLSICCLSETVAVALITAEHVDMPPGSLRDLLARILADEIGHARFGWRWLAEVAPRLSEDAKQRTAGYLAVAFGHLETHELAHLPESADAPPGGPALGLCSGRDARALFYETVREVIVPRLESHGLAAERAWRRRRRPAYSLRSWE